MVDEKDKVSFQLPANGFKGEVNGRGFTFILDEPEDVGGTNEGMKPTEALQGALAGCIAITLRMYANRKGWDTGAINVNVYKTTNDNNETVFHKSIEFGKAEELTKEQIERLLFISTKCPVAKIIQTVNPIILD